MIERQEHYRSGEADHEINVVLLGLSERVLMCWLDLVKAAIPHAKDLVSSVLTGSIPVLFEDIVKALSPDFSRTVATDGTNVAAVHGRERASIQSYTAADLIRELRLLRDAIYGVAEEHGIGLDIEAASVLNESTDQAIVEAISSFCQTHQQRTELFIATLTHDLRTPLHAANLAAQIARTKVPDAKLATLIDRIFTKLCEVDSMIQTLLDASVLSGHMRLKLNIVELDMRAVLDQVAKEYSLPERPVVVQGDAVHGYWCAHAVKRMLDNLISNARKYGASGTPITLLLRRVDHRVFVTVHNEGPQINVDKIEKIFNAFHRLSDTHLEGWGLGLPFVQNAAESHGGSVIVESETDKGTSFIVNLPLDSRPCYNNVALRPADLS